MALPTKDKISFENALKRFSLSTKAAMHFARVCAELALQHFNDHGDVSLCQRFLDAMPKNYNRRAAFERWLQKYSPITKVDGLFAKDKSETAVKFNLEAAFKQPFWDDVPDPEAVVWDDSDVIRSLQSALKRFKRENAKPVNDEAKASFERIEAAVSAAIAAEKAA